MERIDDFETAAFELQAWFSSDFFGFIQKAVGM